MCFVVSPSFLQLYVVLRLLMCLFESNLNNGAPPLPTHFLGAVARYYFLKTITDTRKKPTTV